MTKLANTLQNVINGEVKHVSIEILDDMIKNIGSIDPVLRDKLIYSAFYTLIFGGHLNKREMEYILKSLLKNQLLQLDIEKINTDSVFTRSFTSLVYALILEYDASKQVIDIEIVRQVMDASHEYMGRERDLRGYVENQGWAHAAAHGADLLDSIAKHPVSTLEDALKILGNIERFLTIAEGYQDEEEERMAGAFITLSVHHLTEEMVIEWMLKLGGNLWGRKPANNGDLQPYYAQLAFKNFLKSTYFLLEKKNLQASLKSEIKKLVVKLI